MTSSWVEGPPHPRGSGRRITAAPVGADGALDDRRVAPIDAAVASAEETSYRPGPRERTVKDAQGAVLEVPPDWELLPPGDAMLTRRVKAGPHWVVSEKRGNKLFSRGVWAPAQTITRARATVERERASPEHARQLAAGRARREREQAEYVTEFTRHVLAFLGFHARHASFAQALAERVAEHATPVGSGTVARTERIPVAERAEAAVIAWMRHQTTAYDRMSILRIKGERREVRRRLAQRSRELLERYRRGQDVAPDCPLAAALASAQASPEVANVPRPPVARVATAARPPVACVPPVSRSPVERAAPVPPIAGEEDATDQRLARMKAVRDRLKRR